MDPGCVVSAVPAGTFGKGKAVVVSASVFVSAVFVTGEGGPSPGALIVALAPLADPSLTTLYCCCSRRRCPEPHRQPAATAHTKRRNAIFVFMSPLVERPHVVCHGSRIAGM